MTCFPLSCEILNPALEDRSVSANPDAEALEQAGAMVDRFNRILLRTLRALRDLRRYSGPVIVQNGGQLNVANQQVNVRQACPEK